MRKGWFGWGLAVLLLASVLVGMAADRSGSALVAEQAEKAEPTHRHDLPHFECGDRSGVPYEITADRRQAHVTWMENEIGLTFEQAEQMTSVFDDASSRADRFWKETRDEYCRLRDRLFADARAVMTEDQFRLLGEKMRDENETLDDDSEGHDSSDGSDVGESAERRR